MVALRRHRLDLSTEETLQVGVAELLTKLGVDHEREARLNARDRPDFLTAEGLAIELKIDGGRNAVLRQLLRYAEHERVTGILLVTTRSKHLPVPGLLLGKPASAYQVLSL